VERARAEIARLAGRPERARDAIEESIEAIYGRANLTHQLAWLCVQQAHLSLDVGDVAAATRLVEEARARFTEGAIARGPDYCAAVEERLRAVNSAAAPR
jgi:hypothetical protein